MDIVKRKVYEFIYLQLEKKSQRFTKIYAIQPFCENSERLLAFNSFSQKTPSQMFRWVLNTSLMSGVGGAEQGWVHCLIMPIPFGTVAVLHLQQLLHKFVELFLSQDCLVDLGGGGGGVLIPGILTKKLERLSVLCSSKSL